MKISFAATNPCHVYDMVKALQAGGTEVTFYSGYPRWKLREPGGVDIRSHALRTLVTYSLLRVPRKFRPANRDLFRWQDAGFDRWVGSALEPCDFLHGIPGQCSEAFRAAKRLGAKTVLNHATGPVRQWVGKMRPEYEAGGRDIEKETPYDAAYFERELEEYALADFHCVASTLVRDQLVEERIAAEKIAVVPYGAEGAIFHNSGTARNGGFRILFAGMAGLRKGIPTLLEAAAGFGGGNATMEFFGDVLPEVERALEQYSGNVPLKLHGSVSQERLAQEFRQGSVLVLPSLEEGFGLVVVQALACGLPVIVSEAVGAKDLIQHRVNGSIVPVKDVAALASELSWWRASPVVVDGNYGWSDPARLMVEAMQDFRERSV